MIEFSVTRNGRPLDPILYTWDENTKVFHTSEDDLVLDFSNINGVTFNTGSWCIFKTGSYCTFNTGPYCIFKAYFKCAFNTGSHCAFTTGSNCIFATGSHCAFTTGSNCKFITEFDCTFDTGSNCTFKTRKNCVVIRRDTFEVIKLLKEFNYIKLNEYYVPGYTEILPEVDKELNDFYFTEEDFKIK